MKKRTLTSFVFNKKLLRTDEGMWGREGDETKQGSIAKNTTKNTVVKICKRKPNNDNKADLLELRAQ